MNENPKFKNVVATGQIGANPVIHVWVRTSSLATQFGNKLSSFLVDFYRTR